MNWFTIDHEGLSVDVFELAVLHKDTTTEARVALLDLPLDGVAVRELAVVLLPRRGDDVLVHLVVVDEAQAQFTYETGNTVLNLVFVAKLLNLFEFWRHENGLRLCGDQMVPVFEDVIVKHATFEECLLRFFPPSLIWPVFEYF